jgi:DNA-binding transcriptional LysR family regulator
LLARKRAISLKELTQIFFVSMSERADPGFHDWLCETCRRAGFTPRIVQQVELEPRLISLVADGFGVALVPEQFKNFPIVGVAFRPLAPPLKTDYWIAWNRDNDSNPLRRYIQIIKDLAGNTRQGNTRQDLPAVRPPSRHLLALPRAAASPAPTKPSARRRSPGQ